MPITLISLLAIFSLSAASPIRGGYWPSWTDVPPSSIDTSLFTHLYFAFVPLSNSSFSLEVSNTTAASLSSFVSAVRSKSPRVKTLISIGGGNSNPNRFAALVAHPFTRQQFINSTIHVARQFGIDGLDLDWEFPRNSTEMENLGLLFAEWRAAIDCEIRPKIRARILLTAAVYFSSEFFLSNTRRSYPIDSLGKNLDVINLMCYDYHGSWEPNRTGAHSALRDPRSNINTAYGLGLWIQNGAPKEKLAMGIPLYGRTWLLKDPTMYRIGAPAVGVGPEDGVLTFAQVEHFNKINNATVVYDKHIVSMYSFAGTNWIGYDGPISVVEKIRYARHVVHIGGYFFWAVSYDNKNWEITREAFKAWK